MLFCSVILAHSPLCLESRRALHGFDGQNVVVMAPVQLGFPAFGMLALGMPPLGNQPPCCEKPKPLGEAKCRCSGRINSPAELPADGHIGCQPQK